MELETREPSKLIPCELCGSEAKLLCFCRKCSLCEGCVGKHLVNEPNLSHKPVTFSQNEIASLHEKEFMQIREHEQRLIQEVSERHAAIKIGKSRLKEEITKLDAFKCTCLEYVAVAVEMSKQKLAQAAQDIGKDIVEKCEEVRKVLDEAMRALDSGEAHWILSILDKDKAELWNGHVDVKEVNFEPVLRNGLEFQLTLKQQEVPVVVQPLPETKRQRATPQKAARKLSARPEGSAGSKPAVQKIEPLKGAQAHAPRTTLRALSRKHTEAIMSEEPDGRKKPSRIKLSHTITDDEGDTLLLTKKDSDCPSPEPPLSAQRSRVDSPSSASATSFGFGARSALIQQTAKNVSEISDMLKSMKAPRSSEVSAVHKQWSSLAHNELGSPFDSPIPKTARSTSRRYEFSDDPGDDKALGHSSRNSFPSLPEVIPEEPPREKARLYYITPGSTNMLIRDLEANLSTIKTFEGVENFPKMTFWCATLSGEVFILGGVINETQPSSIRKSCLIYSSTYDTIEAGPNMSTCRYSCSAICVKDAIFVSGGIGSEMAPIKDCEKLDLRARKWKRIANMNIPRESHGITFHAGRIYVAGAPGEQSLETYNPVNDRWALLHFKVSAGGKACICSLGDKIAILHDKVLTFAWVDKRLSENVQELEDKGWWVGGPMVKFGDVYHFLRNGMLFQLSIDKGELLRMNALSISA